jgi:hypothetical protein
MAGPPDYLCLRSIVCHQDKRDEHRLEMRDRQAIAGPLPDPGDLRREL